MTRWPDDHASLLGHVRYLDLVGAERQGTPPECLQLPKSPKLTVCLDLRLRSSQEGHPKTSLYGQLRED